MKTVQIEFVEPRAWKFIWAAAAVVALAITITTAVKVWQLRQQQAEIAKELVNLHDRQLQRLAQEKINAPPKDNPRAASEAAARRLLQRDWNQLYDAIETPALGKVRLVQLSFDAVTGQVMLEYELDTIALAADVTKALSAPSGGLAVWQLERLENGAQGGPVGTGRIRGVWRAVLN